MPLGCDGSPRWVFHLVLCLAALEISSQPAPAQTSWNLVWSDEFNGPNNSAPDPKKWAFDIGGGGWGNNELETYTNRLENAFLENGSLVIKAIRESYTGPDGINRQYTSARLKTQSKFDQAYGRFEARIQVPFGQGIWPAFWMLGNDFAPDTWPLCGEIDIMENIGREPAIVHGTLHGPGYSGGNGIGAPYSIPSGRFADGFHVFAVEWEPGAIRWYVDGNSYQTIGSNGIPTGVRWVFDHPFFLLVNVAVGGSWPGNPDGTTTFPQAMRVDFVRVYQREDITGITTKMLLLPSVTKAHGQGGTNFTTDVWLSNGSDSQMEVKFDFLRSGGFDNSSPTASAQLILTAHETRALPDILGTLFNLSEEFGPLRITAKGLSVDKLAVSSRTSTSGAGGAGSYGLSIDARAVDTTDTSPLYLTGLPQNAAFRSNVGVVNLSAATADFNLTLFDSQGTTLIATTGSLPPYGATQASLLAWFSAFLTPVSSYEGLTLKVTSTSGAPLVAYATPVDNNTGDGAVVYGIHSATGYKAGITYLPVVTKVNGSFGTRWSSRLTVHNPGSQAVDLVLSLQAPNQDNTGAPVLRRTLDSRHSMVLSDVVGQLFQLSSGNYGALRMSWYSAEGVGPVAASQTTTPATTGLGTYGLQVDVFDVARASLNQQITGIRHDSAYRTNIGFANPTAENLSLTCVLRNRQGTVLGSASLSMQPFDYFQRALDSLFGESTFTAGASLTLDVAASAPIFLYGTLIDNITQDPTFLPGQSFGPS